MKKCLVVLLLKFTFSVYAGVDMIRPTEEKICLNGIPTNSHFSEFVRVVHNNQQMLNLPKSRAGLLSTLFVKLDTDHDGRLAENEIRSKCQPCDLTVR